MPLPAKLPASSSKTLSSLTAEKTDVLANRYFIQSTLGIGNCGTALLVLDRKDKDSSDKLLVWFLFTYEFISYKHYAIDLLQTQSGLYICFKLS